MKRIVIYDDQSGYAEEYVQRLRKGFRKMKALSEAFDIDTMNQREFDEQFSLLKERREELRQGKKWTEKSITIDEVSIFIVDYDLFKKDAFLTGEQVAYGVRCFSRCGLIVGLNLESGRRVLPTYFDLTLSGHPDSFCDLNIDSAQLDNPALWTDDKEGFRPWYWPQLPRQLDMMEYKVANVLDNQTKPIMKVLQFDKILPLFPGKVLQFLGGNPEKVTFEEFVQFSGNGLKGKDKTNEEMTARIAAARISKWLERLVLPGQDILVDAPHLVSRFPSLLQGDHQNASAWNKTTAFSEGELGMNSDFIKNLRFEKKRWLSRPAWLWNLVYNCSKIEEVSEPWKAETPKFCFCEDSSTFEKKKLCKEYYAPMDSPYNRRFVKATRFENVDYGPKTLLLQ